MSSTTKVDRDFVRHVGGQILAAQLASQRDPSAVDGAALDRLADISVSAAIALETAIPRAEERLAAEAKATDEARKAAEDADKAAKAAEKVEPKTVGAGADAIKK